MNPPATEPIAADRPSAPDRTRADLSLYIAIPFCTVRCAYCDFNTYAGLEALMAPYARALAKEIRAVGEAGGRPRAHTVFFGGGTPSLLPLELHREIFAALRGAFELTTDCEVTLEANPGTVARSTLAGLRDLGVNRLSFGVQSSHPGELRLLDRLHLFGDVVQAVSWARAEGFDNINLDLIYAIPHQTLAMWQATLLRVLGLGPDHISAYALSLEHGTPMRSWVQRGLLPPPDPDLAAEMYEWAGRMLEANGFAQYEISNWARGADGAPSLAPALACRHNLQYWRNQPYLGFGAGAHGYAGGQRYSDVLAPAAYIARMEMKERRAFPLSPAVAQATPLTRDDEMGETMMMGLRLVREGVADAEFAARFGIGLEQRYGRELRRLSAQKLIEWRNGRVRLTPEARLLGNRVFREFV